MRNHHFNYVVTHGSGNNVDGFDDMTPHASDYVSPDPDEGREFAPLPLESREQFRARRRDPDFYRWR